MGAFTVSEKTEIYTDFKKNMKMSINEPRLNRGNEWNKNRSKLWRISRLLVRQCAEGKEKITFC